MECSRRVCASEATLRGGTSSLSGGGWKEDLTGFRASPPSWPPAALAAQKATTAIPIVMVVAADPVAAGLVASLGRPTGNVTGINPISPELAGQRLGLLKETLPKLSRLAILWRDPSRPPRPSASPSRGRCCCGRIK
ncbi:MAG: ABC transporter substrate binding protein [Candidatus Rokuibacteriota bacterium]